MGNFSSRKTHNAKCLHYVRLLSPGIKCTRKPRRGIYVTESANMIILPFRFLPFLMNTLFRSSTSNLVRLLGHARNSPWLTVRDPPSQ